MRTIVVGGGILGASTGFHLASSGAEVMIVDRSDQGRATAAGAGIICPWFSHGNDPDYDEIAQRGARYYPQLVAMLAELGETDLSYRRVGALSVGDDVAELDRQERDIRHLANASPEVGRVSRLTSAEARALFPPLRGGWQAVHITGGARVDGRSMTAALTRAAVKRGARCVTGDAALQVAGSHVVGVVVDGEMTEADAVIVCAGAWVRPLLRPLGVHLAVEPQRGQIVHLRLPGIETGGWPIVLPLSGNYLLTFDDNRVVAGATWETGAGFDDRVTAGGLAEVLGNALAVAPGLASATVIETRVGFRPVSADGKPMLGRIAGLDGLVVGNGLGSAGLTIAPYAGRILAQAALGQETDLNLAPYDPLRI
jgi:D-amino-acid dehydrogenase